ncbi:hypothetical protein GA0115236_142718 [Streptomyces sp. IgraMP-1]|nr:hypothetical protein GA0115236_142718 [Streptomyces sp. IgraMP-1]
MTFPLRTLLTVEWVTPVESARERRVYPVDAMARSRLRAKA